MAGYPTIYKGADYKFEYGFDPMTGGPVTPGEYRVNAGQVGLATDVRTANQLQEISSKLSTGAKTIEMSAIQPNILDAIPKQHFEEIRRLKKLVGADLTFHGPLIEPTGVNQNSWDEATRQQAERQIWDAVARGQLLAKRDPNDPTKPGENIVITLHSSNGLPSPVVRMKLPDKETGKMVERITNIAVVDERTGKLGYLPKDLLEKDYFLNREPNPKDEIAALNKASWNSELNNLSIETMRGRDAIKEGLGIINHVGEENYDRIAELYKSYRENKSEYAEKLKASDLDKSLGPQIKAMMDDKMEKLNYGEVFIRDSYTKLREMYNKALEAAKRTGDQKKEDALIAYREKAAKKLEAYNNDPLKIKEFSDEVSNGINVITGLYKAGDAPQSYRPLEDFAVEKAAETFGNVAFNAYKKFGENAPIISIENPPVGMGLSRGEELRKVVEATQKHFVERAVGDGTLSKEKAEEMAKRLVGVTWDVGHINMIRKYGYDDNDLVEESKKIKDYVKHVHLSDNFGLEHTELPMGMGNVPLKEHLKALGEKAEKAKKIVETGDWYQHFRSPPFSETLHALGSPIYSMQMQSYWDTAAGMSGVPGYFGGYGLNPDIHHNIYGSGFSGLPTELGGQQPGRAGSRLAGTPME